MTCELYVAVKSKGKFTVVVVGVGKLVHTRVLHGYYDHSFIPREGVSGVPTIRTPGNTWHRIKCTMRIRTDQMAITTFNDSIISKYILTNDNKKLSNLFFRENFDIRIISTQPTHLF